jgi:hypothetical protein
MEPLSLAFSVSRNKGAYALLIGSGVSQSATIPTGWNVTLDLVRQIASLQGKTITTTDSEQWYREEFGREPNYSDILKQVAPTPAERNAVLRGYFSATPEERDHNIKVSQEAHRAIAELVAGGYIRIIVTTNFDTLIEDALVQAGVDANIISTVDGIKGATPLPHAACTVVKIHGDWRDARIRNTELELSKYPREIDRLLNRIFDEYGLIVCGWSGDWDHALRAALERRKSQRYTTYWTHRGPLEANAERLTTHLKAESVRIPGADQFFVDLSERVKSIADTAHPHPLSARVAEATVKRYVVEDRHRILLTDLVLREARRVHDTTAWPTTRSAPGTMSAAELEQRLAFYQTQTQTLMAMMAAGCYWGEVLHHRIWGRALRRLSHFEMQPGGRWLDTHNLQLYPTLLAIYSGGIAALGAERYDTLAAMLLQESWPDPQFKVSTPMAMHAIPGRSLTHDLAKLIPSSSRSITPVSDYLRDKSGIRDATQEVWIDDDNFDDLFDWFEYFLGMVNWDLSDTVWKSPWAYTGGFVWRENPSRRPETMRPVQRYTRDISTMGDDWPPLKAGFFSGTAERAMEVATAYLESLGKSVWR